MSASCRSSCEATCDNLSVVDTSNCAIECGEQMCVCSSGYVRLSSTDRTCVQASSCPTPAGLIGWLLISERQAVALTFLTSVTVSCEAPKIYAECPSRCQPTCANPNPLSCTRGCDLSILCVCPTGYVQKDSIDRTCVLLEECQSKYVSIFLWYENRPCI